QGRREFWRDFRKSVPVLDIVIDDGSHLADHQIVSFEELLPHLRAGGVYCCEDIHGYPDNGFGSYILQYASGLNDHRGADNKHSIKRATSMQADIHSVHLYPYVAVVEKNAAPVAEFVAPKRGSEWQTFLK
ncbi:MAG TPA: hypothetical protein VFK30_01370, partial [Anaerolineae bacterium]|nr:hypothetical protein [Anaerolineae bacterium]